MKFEGFNFNIFGIKDFNILSAFKSLIKQSALIRDDLQENETKINDNTRQLQNHIKDEITKTNKVHGIKQGTGGQFDADKLDGYEADDFLLKADYNAMLLTAFLTDTNSDVSGYYYYTYISEPASSTLTITNIEVGNNQILFSFINDNDEGLPTILASGNYIARIVANKTNKKMTIKLKFALYERDSSNGDETLILESNESEDLLTSNEERIITAYLQDDYLISIGNRLVFKLIANVTGAGGLTTDVTVYLGDTDDSRFALNTTTSSFKEIFALEDLSNVDDEVILTKLKNVDGSGSGLNADMLDGFQASSYYNPVAGTLLSLDNNAKFPNSVLYTGSGNGLDADKLDGQEGTYYADSNLSNVDDNTILDKLKSVDGAGSELDADYVRGLPADFTNSKNTNGYTKLPNGIIIQWGKINGTSDGGYIGVDVTFPVAFPNTVLSIQVTPKDISGAGKAEIGTYKYITNESFRCYVEMSNNLVDGVTLEGFWLAIGY